MQNQPQPSQRYRARGHSPTFVTLPPGTAIKSRFSPREEIENTANDIRRWKKDGVLAEHAIYVPSALSAIEHGIEGSSSGDCENPSIPPLASALGAKLLNIVRESYPFKIAISGREVGMPETNVYYVSIRLPPIGHHVYEITNVQDCAGRDPVPADGLDFSRAFSARVGEFGLVAVYSPEIRTFTLVPIK